MRDEYLWLGQRPPGVGRHASRFATSRSHVLVRSAVFVTLALSSLVGLSTSVSASTSARSRSLSSKVAAAPLCATSKLVIWINTEGNGAAGSIYYNLEFTNLGATSCVVQGYAGVSAVNLAGHQIGSPASRDRAFTPTLITLGHGESAKAILQVAETGNYPPSFCKAGTAAGLRVYPPGQAVSKVVPFPFSACMSSGESYLHIEGVQAATAEP